MSKRIAVFYWAGGNINTHIHIHDDTKRGAQHAASSHGTLQCRSFEVVVSAHGQFFRNVLTHPVKEKLPEAAMQFEVLISVWINSVFRRLCRNSDVFWCLYNSSSLNLESFLGLLLFFYYFSLHWKRLKVAHKRGNSWTPPIVSSRPHLHFLHSISIAFFSIE